ncbi:MAG: hypothetical protein LUF35_05460 [Lachnospiraceae bacterium]|nr:hypothetical protein [Lachnospiraceae bacterium]
MLTRLDQIANQNHLQLVKALLPHLPTHSQKTFSILIKLMEIQNIMKYYTEQPEDSGDLLDILADLKEYCEGEEQEMIDQALQMISMIELYQMFAPQPEPVQEEPKPEEPRKAT